MKTTHLEGRHDSRIQILVAAIQHRKTMVSGKQRSHHESLMVYLKHLISRKEHHLVSLFDGKPVAGILA